MTLDEPKLWSPEGFRDDEWQRGSADDVQASNSQLILSLQDFLGLPEGVRNDALPRLGVEISSGEPLEPLLPFLDRLALIALAFPAFSDGRGYSKATLLRARYAYQGTLRATGDVLIDQVSHMLRCGFSELEVRNRITAERLTDGNTGIIPFYYQPAVSDTRPEKYAWRSVRL